MPHIAIFLSLYVGFAAGLLFCLSRIQVAAAKTDSIVPAIKEIRTFNLKPGDVLVLKFSVRIGPEMRDSIKEQMSYVLRSGIKIMVIDASLDIDSVLKCETSGVKEG